MGWLFAEVWVLCVVAFLVGAAVTWLVFVRPLRGAARESGPEPQWTPVPRWASGDGDSDAGATPPAEPEPEVARRPEPPAGPPTDPALSVLDIKDGVSRRGGPGTTATGALDMLGVKGADPPKGAGQAADAPVPDIPTQPGPADAPNPGEGRDGGRA